MNTDIQSIAAPLVVFLTLVVMIYLRSRKKGNGCGSGCGCSKKADDTAEKK